MIYSSKLDKQIYKQKNKLARLEAKKDSLFGRKKRWCQYNIANKRALIFFLERMKHETKEPHRTND